MLLCDFAFDFRCRDFEDTALLFRELLPPLELLLAPPLPFLSFPFPLELLLEPPPLDPPLEVLPPRCPLLLFVLLDALDLLPAPELPPFDLEPPFFDTLLIGAGFIPFLEFSDFIAFCMICASVSLLEPLLTFFLLLAVDRDFFAGALDPLFEPPFDELLCEELLSGIFELQDSICEVLDAWHSMIPMSGLKGDGPIIIIKTLCKKRRKKN